MKFLLQSIPFAILVASRVRAEGTGTGRTKKKPLLRDRALASDVSGQGAQKTITCSTSKTVTVLGFCKTDDLDEDTYSSHQLYISDFYSDETRRFHNECDLHAYEPVGFGSDETITIGALIHNPLDVTIEDYSVDIPPKDWYDNTCGTYEISVSTKFVRGGGAAACWTVSEGEQPHLGIPDCNVDGNRQVDHSFTWYIQIKPEVSGSIAPKPEFSRSIAPQPELSGSIAPKPELSSSIAQASYPVSDDYDDDTVDDDYNQDPSAFSYEVYSEGRKDHPAGWKDSFDKSCDWYASHPDRCINTHLRAKGGHSASTACVVCGGGVYMNDKFDYPSGWVDSVGDGCDWYGEHAYKCSVYGYGYSNAGYNAQEACVVCGGGVKRVDYPEHWVDSVGDTCEWYESNIGWCDFDDADEHCAICGGGVLMRDFEEWQDSDGHNCDFYAFLKVLGVDECSFEQGSSSRVACMTCGGGYIWTPP